MPRFVNSRSLAKRPSAYSEQLRAQHPDVPWRRIAGLRDVLIHNYMGVDLNAVWEITQQDLPPLRVRLMQILDESEGES